MKVPFVKMHGAANDFVVVDHRQPFLSEPVAPMIARMCDRRRGVGADGVLLLDADDAHDFAMTYFNADGRRADWCGNGARCLARFALDRGLGHDGVVRFRTDAGAQRARRLGDGRIALELEGFATRPETLTLETPGRRFIGSFVRAGVPHFVTPVDDLEGASVTQWGRALRSHTAFGSEGANVDFVTTRGPGRVSMRTYERGVEGETLACGSGAIATAVWAVGSGDASPVTILTAGGDTLEVSLLACSVRYDVTLTGPAEAVYTGVWEAGTGALGKEA